MMRRILALILGAFTASLILLIVGAIANSINPTPPEMMDPKSPEEVAKRVASATTFTWISTIFGLSLGAFFGGILGVLIAKTETVWITLGIGMLLSIWAFYTFYIVFPSVLWVPAIMLISAFLFSYLGSRVISRNMGHSDN